MENAINVVAATCVLILLVLLFRRLFWKKCNPNLLYFLWIFVALRILVPVSMPYMVSAGIGGQQSEETLSIPASGQEMMETNESTPADDTVSDIAGDTANDTAGNAANGTTGNAAVDTAGDAANAAIGDAAGGAVLTDAPAVSDRDLESGVNTENPTGYKPKPHVSLKKILLLVWLCGCILCAGYFLFINVRTFRHIAKTQVGKVHKTVKVYKVEGYNCLVGVWKPHIFITPQVAENPVYRKYVLMHEMEHYKVKDNFWLLLRTICLSIQWFNPLVWIAYFKAQEDCELACDYRVLSKLRNEEKNAYADTLLYLLESNPKAAYLASSMGKEGYKKRFDSIYKERNTRGFVFLCSVMGIATILAFVQITVSRAKMQAGGGMQNEKVWMDLENRTDSDSAAEEEETYILYAESLEDVKRGESLDYENCYTTDITRGGNHYWIDEEKVLWGVGYSEYGQLKELKEDLGRIFEPVRIAENVKHVDFSGEYFVIFITGDNKLYGLGGNAAGILQEADREVRNSAYMNVVTEPVLLMENVVFAKCGYTSVIALTENRDVYVLGNNDYVPSINESYYEPQKVMEHAKYVSAYYHTYAVIGEDNSLWTWGYNDMGQCGNGTFFSPVAAPQKVMEDVDCVWTGKVSFNSTGEVTEQDNLIVRKTDGSYYACGAEIGADFRQAEIRQFVPFSLGSVELLWSEDELKQFLDSKQVDYYLAGQTDDGYLFYMANKNEWEFVFNSAGELVSIASNKNDALEENLLRQGDSFDKVTEAYGEAYTRTDGEYNDFMVEYEREDYCFRVYCYSDLGCAKFCKCIKGVDQYIIGETIDKYRIPEQSFDIALDDWGEVTFVSCRPPAVEEQMEQVDGFEDASFYLMKDNQILYRFPYRFENNSSKGYGGLYIDVGEVSFQDINHDQKEDIIIITHYVSGAGPTGMVPRPGIRIFIAGDHEFYLDEDIMADVEEHISNKDMNIDNISSYLLTTLETEPGQVSVLEAYDPSWSEERMLEELENRKPYLDACSFYSEVLDYMENTREVRDISMYVEPLYATDTRRYTEEDFTDVPPLIIHLAKNEIYARHGYLFSNEDLYNYFMGQLWYRPSVVKEEFDDSVLNEYEIENIRLLSNLDTY